MYVATMTEPVVDRLEEVWQHITDLCADLTEEQWSRPTECPGWTVKDNVAHMIGTEMMLLGEQAPPVDLGDTSHVKNDIGKANEQWVALYRAMAGKEVIDEFRAVTLRRLTALHAMTKADFDKEGFTPEGPGPYRRFMEIRVFDCWYHEQDIREAVEMPGGLDGPVADLSLARIGDKGLGYVVGKKAGAPPDSSVVFDVLGTPKITVAIVVPPEGRAFKADAPPANPTTTITFDRRTYARLAGGRWTGDEARTRGAVRVAGDADLGARVVDNMAFTI
jgi:uncharacterized protein (TIGR03083 family)